MKVITQMGKLDINPESVMAIRKAPVIPGMLDFGDLTHCVEFDDRFYDLGDNVVCISESDAKKLAEMAGIEIDKGEEEEPSKANPIKESQNPIFVTFAKQFVLNQWEVYFDASIAWKRIDVPPVSTNTVTEPNQAPSSYSTDSNSKEGEDKRSDSLIEKAFCSLEYTFEKVSVALRQTKRQRINSEKTILKAY